MDREKLRKQFLKKHSDLCKSESFQFFRSTEVSEKLCLRDILKHAHENDNRSREVCIDLGWMNQDGTLKEGAPLEIRAIHDEWKARDARSENRKESLNEKRNARQDARKTRSNSASGS